MALGACSLKDAPKTPRLGQRSLRRRLVSCGGRLALHSCYLHHYGASIKPHLELPKQYDYFYRTSDLMRHFVLQDNFRKWRASDHQEIGPSQLSWRCSANRFDGNLLLLHRLLWACSARSLLISPRAAYVHLLQATIALGFIRPEDLPLRYGFRDRIPLLCRYYGQYPLAVHIGGP